MAGNDDIITILLVDDIPETRENIKKLLAFEQDFKVVDSAGTGREGVELAKKHKPNIIIMDINMPDMDGIQATSLITEAVPTTAVIMMSVQNDPDYLRKAMLAGARNFLTKPINTEELYNTIRTVHERNKPLIAQYKALEESGTIVTSGGRTAATTSKKGRAGNIVVIYSPSGGTGTTTIATNVAAGLMKEDIKVLLVDADLQFGDIDAFLNLQAQTTIVDLVGSVDDLDTDLFDNIVVTHPSGLKVLMGPARPEFAEEVKADPKTVANIIQKIATNYDYIVVDTSTAFDEMLLSLFDIATKIVLIGTPTLPSIKNIRFVLDLFDQLGYPQDKSVLVLNRTWDERQRGTRATLPIEKIEQWLKRQIAVRVPLVDERVVLSAINRGIAVIDSDRDHNKSPIKELLTISDQLHTMLMGSKEEEPLGELDKSVKRGRSLFARS